jgi:LmbE family N-acetylglucosaminyl deacetylase
MMDMPQERPELADLDFPTPEQMENLGVPGELITTNVDVRDYLSEKRAAMAAHASQISEASFFLALPPDISVLVWGLESYVLRGAPEGSEEDWLL